MNQNSVYYNTTVRVFKSQECPSVRFVRFSDVQHYSPFPLASLHKCSAAAQPSISQLEVDPPVCHAVPRNYKGEAVSRARRVLKMIIRQNFSTRLKFLTLTYEKKVESRKKVFDDIKNMAKRYKTETEMKLRYIATLEWQEPRHCLHVHLIVDCPYIDASVWRYRLWQQGFVKINSIAKNSKISSCQKLLRYTLKYLEKDAYSNDDSRHLYLRSHNWRACEKVQRMTTTDTVECISLAKRYFNQAKYSVESFDFEIYPGMIVQVVDVYCHAMPQKKPCP